ncbi:MAG: methionyl-tRNA formyltransferase [Alphaproteobacteria bacterium]
MASVLLLGGTDVTLSVGDALIEAGVKIVALVGVEQDFAISYSATRIKNMRAVDTAKWCRDHDVEPMIFNNFADLTKSPIAADLCLVAGWYHMVPRSFRDLFPLGCLGLHASLLPQLRGGAPLNWAILNGLDKSGVTLFALSDGVDDGEVFAQQTFPIGPRTHVGELVEASRRACATLVEKCVPAILTGKLSPGPQSGAASYGLQRTPADGVIDWRDSAVSIDRLVRAVSAPYPGASTHLEDRRLLIWDCDPLDTPMVSGAPGQIIWLRDIDRACVVTGSGLLAIKAATSHEGEDVMDVLRRSSNKRFS